MSDVEHWGVLTIGTGLGNARFTNRSTQVDSASSKAPESIERVGLSAIPCFEQHDSATLDAPRCRRKPHRCPCCRRELHAGGRARERAVVASARGLFLARRCTRDRPSLVHRVRRRFAPEGGRTKEQRGRGAPLSARADSQGRPSGGRRCRQGERRARRRRAPSARKRSRSSNVTREESKLAVQRRHD